MSHTCHWPGCEREVPPNMWGCAPHWYKLPKDLRDRIWAAYVPGQEITKTPSAAYLEVAREAERYARALRVEPGTAGRRDSAPDTPAAQGLLF